MLKQTAILSAISALIETEYAYPIYTNEIVEGFSQPCFFIKLIKRTDTESLNTNSNALSIIITYFASPDTNKEIAYLDMTDDMNLIFDTGFQVSDRYLHVKNFTADRIGEKQDILQVTIQIDYFDNTNRKEQIYDLMKKLNLAEHIRS